MLTTSPRLNALEQHSDRLPTGAALYTLQVTSRENAVIAFTTRQAADDYIARNGLSTCTALKLESLEQFEHLGGEVLAKGITKIVVDVPQTGEHRAKDLATYVRNVRKTLKPP